jgi:diguanylate cyclase (GGDEF)-like protein
LFIGLDRFKAINESLGTSVGDQLVKQFAERLVNETLGSDYVNDYTDYNINEMIVSRLSGSEFNLLINKLKDTRDILNTVKDVFRIVEKPFIVEKHEIFLSISIGVVVYPGDATDEDSLIKNGRFVMGYARERGENNYEFFSESLNVAAFHKLSMVNSLRQAIEQDELLLFYHARIDMLKNRVIGCEALIRWQHPDLGLVSPTQFIPIAEDAGLMSYISSWVLESACKQMRDWQLQNIPLQIMAVNVSAAQFRQANFAEQVEQLLARQELAPEHLKIELTESILLEGIKNDLETVKKLNDIGVKVSIDDFGTGFSSLAYLKKLPISELKIDRSFIRDIPNNTDDMAITQAILALAKSLALDVVAEGVENQGQIDFLLANGCKLAQGFFYCRPVQSDEFPSVVLKFNS